MRRKLLSILLSLCMALSLLPVTAIAAETGFSDMPAENYWSYEALTAAVENDLLQGDNGRLMPQESLTRAQLATIINRAFGAEETADTDEYSDVSALAWYYTDIAKAVRMGSLQGSGSGKMRPNDSVTRQEAFVVLARAIKLTDGDTAALDAFSDKADIASWAAPYIADMAGSGYIQGSGGKLNPTEAITREAFAQLIHNIFSLYISKPGTYTEHITGNVIISSDDVTLKGLTITGDLIVGEGVGNGDFTMDGVTVTGRLVVRGGGENSIHIINNSGVGSIIVAKTGDGGVRVRTEEGCRVEVVYVDDGLDDVILEGSFNQVTVSTDAPVVLKDATVTGLTVSGKGSNVKLEGATNVAVTQITENAAGATLEVGIGAKVTKVESAAESVTISGEGKVTQAVVSGNNTAVNTSGTKVTQEEGATGVTQNGKTVEPAAPSGGSSDGDSPSYTSAVTTLTELQAALSNGSVSAITIRAGITIPAGTTVTFSKPVTIADLTGAMLVIGGTLINNSTFTSRGLGGMFSDTGMELGGTFTNNGTFDNETRFGMFKAVFTNNGTVKNKEWLHCAGTAITNNGTFSSIGDISLLNSDAFEGTDNIRSTFTNSAGATLVSDSSGTINIGSTCTFTNSGTVTSRGSIDNYGTLTNTAAGSFTYTGYILNVGTISGTITPSGEDAALKNFKPATTLSALNASLAYLEPGYVGIAIIGDIELTESLTVSKYVLITPDCTLIVPLGVTLTVSCDEASAEEFNQLLVYGKLNLNGGALVTTQNVDGEKYGQVTIAGGVLIGSETEGYTITNNGRILFLHGEINPDDITVGGSNAIIYLPNISGVTTEAALRSAMSDPDVDEITIEGNITLTSALDITKTTTVTYDDIAASQRTLTVPSGVTVTVKAGGRLSILGNVVNNGTIIDSTAGNGMFMGSYGSFTNSSTGILNVDNRFDILEGVLINNGTVDISSGNEHTILVMGGTVTNHADAVFINDGALDMGTSAIANGAIHDGGSTFTNTGTFTNGGISTPSSSAYFGMMSGTFSNTGRFVNNGNMDINYTSFTHADGTFDTYNAGGLVITGGSFSTDGAPDYSFNNEGYMKVIDQYGKDGHDYFCDITLGITSPFNNDSKWMEYTAAVYSADSLADAETAQQSKKTDLSSGENYFGFSVYKRLDFMADTTVANDTAFAGFDTYWVESAWSWDGLQDVQTPATLTVASGKTLTIGQDCALNVDSGSLVNDGTIAGAGCVEVWPEASFTNSGAVTNSGDFYIRREYALSGNMIQADISGLDDVSVKFIAIVHNEADLIAANSCDSPVYDRIEIKNNCNIEITGSDTLTIDKNVYIEPGSGLIVPYGKTLAFTGSHWVDSGGDISVYGAMIIGGGVSFFNNQNFDIGAASGGQTATVTISSDGILNNAGWITIYATGTLNASDGQYQGGAPVGAGTYMGPSGG